MEVLCVLIFSKLVLLFVIVFFVTLVVHIIKLKKISDLIQGATPIYNEDIECAIFSKKTSTYNDNSSSEPCFLINVEGWLVGFVGNAVYSKCHSAKNVTAKKEIYIVDEKEIVVYKFRDLDVENSTYIQGLLMVRVSSYMFFTRSILIGFILSIVLTYLK